jgi:hypothetical protein
MLITDVRRFSLMLILLGLFLYGPPIARSSAQNNLKLFYSFDKLTTDSSQIIDESGNGYNATLFNGARTKSIGKYRFLDLGSTNGYLDLGTQLGALVSSMQDFSVATYLYIDPSVSVTDAGNFIWSFGNSNNLATDKNGGMFFTAKSTRFAISLTDWSAEQQVNYAAAFITGVWKHVAYVQSGNIGNVYIDGILVKSGAITTKPSQLGSTKYNYIGRSLYSGDAYLKKSYLTDVRIYNKALTGTEIVSLTANLSDLNKILIQQQLTSAVNALTLQDLSKVNANITLPYITTDGITISWTSSNSSIITSKGIVTRPAIGQTAAQVQLTATLSKNGEVQTKIFTVTVMPMLDDQSSVNLDADAISLAGNLNNLRTDLTLPVSGAEGSSVTWQSDKSSYLTASGILLKPAPQGGGKLLVTLTATITRGTASTQKKFSVYIAEDEGYSAYLFAYFTGNDIAQEAIRFAVSNDGYTYRALNNNNPVVQSSVISSTGGVRDPHIYRGPDGKFYMVATDMVSANGWSSNRAIVLLKSTDLINWQSSIVNIQNKYGYADLLRVWAPQTIYDSEAGKLMIYFSMKRGTGPDIIYYAYANAGFTDIEAEPKQLFYSPTSSSCIDADIIPMGGKYHMFFKTEGNGNGIKKAVSDKLTSRYVLYDQYLQQTTVAVEGASVFKLINSDDYILMYDMYTSGTYQFTKSTDLVNFKVIDNEISMNFTPRHGTVMTITANEARKLTEKWGTKADLTVLSADGANVKKKNVVIDNTLKNVYVPVKRNADLAALDPGLKTLPGATINPPGIADFSKGPVNYTLSIPGTGSVNYAVTASVDNNPVLDGYYADPEILYAKKTGKYYLYPTSDGFTSWSGTYFKAFSSDNLTDWKDEGVILDLPASVSWGTTSAWAPTIVERKIDGQFKYFYYFCAAQKIGVAVSDNPTGPFIDSGSALITSGPSGVSGGQAIDPDVFHDPVSNKYYLYWGNGYMACAELNDDMISVNASTIKAITPNSTFREGTEVAYRNGTYYFFWSENDTRSEDYQVRYATAASPAGPLTVPSSNLVIAKDAGRAIYATGHNSVIQIAGKNEWYIIYHRFTRPKGITMGSAAGYNREVCIDSLKFNSNGSIKQVQPTLEGISPLFVPATGKKKIKSSTSLMVFPNPANDILNVRYALNNDNSGIISIFNLYGQKVIQCTAKNDLTQIDVSGLNSDVYLLAYSVNSRVVGMDKVIKN